MLAHFSVVGPYPIRSLSNILVRPNIFDYSKGALIRGGTITYSGLHRVGHACNANEKFPHVSLLRPSQYIYRESILTGMV